jgi:hypothetical protein
MAGEVSGPLIVTAQLGAADLAWLDQLRRRHYPAERNQLPAHLTLFRALPPSAEGQVRQVLGRLAASPRPEALLAGLMDLGGGVAFRVVSDELDGIREDIARSLHGLLSAQDAGGWVAHVTIQNKVETRVARALKRSLEAEFSPRRLGVAGLGLHRYLGGPWEKLQAYSFRGAS